MNSRQRIIKRLFDLLVSSTGLVLLSPLLTLVALLILFFDGRPVFFKQERVGYMGNSFLIIKFRTMITNNNKLTVTLYSDKRITKLGKFLRKKKIDELPSLINVIFGDMSLVGPRPDVKGFADKLKGRDRRILLAKPGITSFSSIKYRNEERLLDDIDDPVSYNKEVIYPDKVKLNLSYIDNWSLSLDLKIIFKTIFS